MPGIDGSRPYQRFIQKIDAYVLSFHGSCCRNNTGIMKLIFGFSILYILVPGYILGIVLTYLSTEEFVNVGWDSAGVTTGPITVPLVLAMGLGFGKAVGAVEGFGILAAASISPIVAVLALGVYVQWRVKKDNERAALEAADDTAKA